MCTLRRSLAWAYVLQHPNNPLQTGLMQGQGQGLPGLMHMHHPNNPPEMDLMQGQGQGLINTRCLPRAGG